MDSEPEKKPLKELIKNAYKENKLIRDILAVLYKRKAIKYTVNPSRLKKLLRCNKSEYSIINGLIYYRNRVFVPNSPKL